MQTVFEDDDIFVCIKPAGLDSEKGATNEILKCTGNAVFTVHRLDTAVSGLMVFAKNKTAAVRLSEEIAEKNFLKQYFAVAEGNLEKSGEMEDLLFKDSSKNKSFVVKRMRRGVRKASLSFETLGSKNGLSLVLVTLNTGRSHQIRVQFSSRRAPLYGDRKYGSAHKGSPALYSCRLEFEHPATGEKMSFFSRPDFYPFTEFVF